MNDAVGRHGRLELVLGPMMSGKTTEMIRRVRRYIVMATQPESVLLIRYAGDTRYDDENDGNRPPSASSPPPPPLLSPPPHGGKLSPMCSHITPIRTHEHAAIPALAVAADGLADVDVRDIRVIGLDEGQFFHNMAATVDRWAFEGRTVVVAALNGKFNRTGWPQVAAALPVADDVCFLTSVCTSCLAATAAYSCRTIDSQEDEVIGHADAYKPLCRRCWHATPRPK